MATKSIINYGFNSIIVDVECSISKGLPSITIVGMATKAVDEAKERIRVAINNSGLVFPRKRIVINLAPAELPKDTASLDLSIALAILQADNQISKNLNDCIFIGELGLDGRVRPIRGIIGKLLAKECANAKAIYIPKGNIGQAELINQHNIYAIDSLIDIIDHLNKVKSLQPIEPINVSATHDGNFAGPDFSEIYGQDTAKRALVVAAAGGHNVLMTGPPGTGKSMLAKAFIGILPSLTPTQSLEVTHIHSLGLIDYIKTIQLPPLRSPHHTASDVAIIGGGHHLKPGEISLAHHGVLFLTKCPNLADTP